MTVTVSVFISVNILYKCCSRPNNAQKVGLFKARVNLFYIQHHSCIKPPGGGGYCHVWALLLCAAVRGMVFKQFTVG